MFQLKDISLAYDGSFVLGPLDLQIQKGEFVGILGPNGAGKSSLLRILAGLLPPSGGEALFEGKNLALTNPRERAKKIALVPQWTLMAFSFTVGEIVSMGRYPHLGPLTFESPRDLEIVERAMNETDTLRFKERSFGQLSGGEMQRVVLARAVAQEAPAMLLDEPTAALDLHHQQKILQILSELNARGTTVVMATHHINLASFYCHRVLLLDGGKIAVEGKPEDVLTPENIERIYKASVQRVRVGNHSALIPLKSDARKV